jgi:hypothetical protein
MANHGDRQDVTSYLLGELGDDETTQIRIEIERDDTLRTEVDELKTFSDLISGEFKSEEAQRLTSEQRNAILEAASLPASPERAEPIQLELWERFEFLAVFVSFQIVTFMLPHLPVGLRILVRKIGGWIYGGFDEGSEELLHADEWIDRWFGLLDGHSAGYYRASVVAALIAVTVYAWTGTRTPRSRAVLWDWLWAGVVFIFSLAVILKVSFR